MTTHSTFHTPAPGRPGSGVAADPRGQAPALPAAPPGPDGDRV